MALLLVTSAGLMGVGAVTLQDENNYGDDGFIIPDVPNSPETVEQDTNVSVTVNVTNVKDAGTGPVTATVYAGDDATDAGAEKVISLDRDETKSVQLNVSTDRLAVGEYDLVVSTSESSFALPLNVTAADDGTDEDGQQPDGSYSEFIPSDVSFENPVTAGETLTIDAKFSNTGANGTETIEAGFDTDGDSQIDTSGVERNLTLEREEVEDVSFELSTDGLEPGNYTLIVAGEQMDDPRPITVVANDTDDEQNDDNQDDSSSEERYYQVDLVVGEPKEKLGETTEDFYSPEGRLVSYLHGTSSDGETSSGTAGSLDAEYSDVIDASKIEVSEDGETADVTVTVADGESLTLSLVSYETPDATFDWDETQTMHDAETKTLEGDTYTFTVDLDDAES